MRFSIQDRILTEYKSNNIVIANYRNFFISVCTRYAQKLYAEIILYASIAKNNEIASVKVRRKLHARMLSVLITALSKAHHHRSHTLIIAARQIVVKAKKNFSKHHSKENPGSCETTHAGSYEP